MAWTTPRTWVVGEVVTAALMNTHVRDNLSYLHAELYDSTLGVAAASFDITSIDSGYAHLLLTLTGRSDRAANLSDDVRLRFNNDSGNSYDWQSDYSSGTGGATGTEAIATSGMRVATIPAATATANFRGVCRVLIANYAETTFHKDADSSWGYRQAAATGQMISGKATGFWNSTAAINRLTLTTENAANFVAGTRVTLHGVAT